MSEKNKAILEKGNAAIAAGDNEGFLRFCTDDTEWTFVGDRTLKGKEAVRRYMAATYKEPPKFTVHNLIAEGDFVTALGDITLKDEDGKATQQSYCDVWRFRAGKIVGLKAFVIKPEAEHQAKQDTMTNLDRNNVSEAVKVANRSESAGHLPESSPSATDDIHPHPFAFPDAALDDLRERLARTRWSDRETVNDWSQGAPLVRMQALCDYWRNGYDWRAAEARLNALEPSMTRIDGLDIHFLHLRSPEPNAVPLVMTHGWPGSVFEFLKVAPLLADPRANGGDAKDAFHVVLPTLPGFGLSGKPTEPGWTPERIAQAWVVLMRRLSYDRFVAQGGDWGFSVTNALGDIGAPAVEAVHFSMFPINKTMEAKDAQEERALKRLQAFEDNESGYRDEQIQSPQTIGYGLTDSPVGQAAWLYEKYEQWTDHDGDPEHTLSRDEMLDNITLYWLTATAASSARIYWQNSRSFKEHPIEVPVGVSLFPRDIHLASRRWVQERYPTLVHYNELPRGGHFAAWEQPELFAEEVRASFRHSR